MPVLVLVLVSVSCAIDSISCDAAVMASHDPESHVAPHFDYLDLRNILLPLIMPLVSCDTDTSINGITFQMSGNKECNGPIDNATSSM